jgi:hypothetical protein
MAVGCFEGISRAMAKVAVCPTLPQPGFFDGSDAAFQRLRTARSPGEMGQPGLVGSSQFQGVVFIIIIGP